MKINPYFVLAVAVLGVSLSAIFVRFTQAPSEVVAFYRLLFTFIFSLPLVLSTKKYQWKKISSKDLALIFGSALFLALHFITWFISLDYTSVASSTVLVNTQPFFVILFGWLLFKIPIGKNTVISVLLAIAGSVILSWGDFSAGGNTIYGDILALIGAIFIAIHYLFSSYLRTRIDTIPYTTLLYGFCTIILAAAVLLRGYSFVGYNVLDYGMFISLAFFCTILGHTLFSWCMKYLDASAVSLSVLGEPVIAAIIAYFLFAEKFSLGQFIGGLIVLVSIFGYLYEDNKQKKTLAENSSSQ